MQQELEALALALGNPKRPVVAIVGGAKVSTKLDLLGNLVTKVDVLIIGGGMANTFLFAEGKGVGKSLCEKDLADTARSIVAAAEKAKCRILLPVDATVAKEFKAHAPAHVVERRSCARGRDDPRHRPEVGRRRRGGAWRTPRRWSGTARSARSKRRPSTRRRWRSRRPPRALTKARQAEVGRRRRRHGRGAQRGRGRRRLHLCLDRGRRVPRMDGRQGAAGRRGAEGEVATGWQPSIMRAEAGGPVRSRAGHGSRSAPE